MGRKIALDVGKRKIGIAISDCSNTLAKPYKVIESRGAKEDSRELMRIATENDIDEMVVGLPVTLRAEVGAQAEEVYSYAKIIGAELNLDIKFRDERFTSKEASRRLKEAGSRKLEELEDAGAAALILQEYLDSRKVL